MILLDVEMPEAERLRDLQTNSRGCGRAHIPILMVTGLEDIESVNRLFGATDFLPKADQLVADQPPSCATYFGPAARTRNCGTSEAEK